MITLRRVIRVPEDVHDVRSSSLGVLSIAWKREEGQGSVMKSPIVAQAGPWWALAALGESLAGFGSDFWRWRRFLVLEESWPSVEA